MSRPLRVVAIIAAYNEADIIGQVVAALIGDGVSVYLLDHQSTDGTAGQVARYLDRGVIGIESFPPQTSTSAVTSDMFTWEAILGRKSALASELDADWFIHHDADEFRESPWNGETLRDGIERVDRAGYNAIDFQLLNFCPTAGDRSGAEDIRERMPFYEPADDWNRTQIKCWKRTDHAVDLVSSGGHEATFENRRIFPIRFLLRHYPIRSQAHGERKVFRERKPRFLGAERQRGWHVQYDAFHEGASFIRDQASLIRFDADAVRLEVCVRNRHGDALEAELIPLRQHLASLSDELDRLRPVVMAQDVQLDELRRHLAIQDAELPRLRPVFEQLAHARRLCDEQEQSASSLRREVRAREAEISGLRDSLTAVQQHVADLLTSRSWRVTAPLRAAQRWLTGK